MNAKGAALARWVGVEERCTRTPATAIKPNWVALGSRVVDTCATRLRTTLRATSAP